MTLLAGCGGTPDLTAEQKANVARFESAFATNALDGSRFTEVLRGVDYLISLCRKNPDAKYDERTMRQVVEDAASTLESSHPDDAVPLDRAARSGCK